MWKIKTSPKVLKATDKYIASIGRKREELTEEQWNLMVNYIKTRRLAIPSLIFFGLICAIFTLMYYHLGHKYLTMAIPHHTVTISFEGQQEPITLSPEEIRKYSTYVTDCYMMAGTQLMLAFESLIFIVISLTITRIYARKGHIILLSRPTSTESVV
ncbi:MAG: hypothetical protein ABSG97_06220 [Sedimentisphaerales bacterium]|jgi:hypothetical protein